MSSPSDNKVAPSDGPLVRAPLRERRSPEPLYKDIEPIPLEPIPSHFTHMSRHSLHCHFEPEADAERRPVVDIEHAPVDDDPRAWSNRKKNFVLTLMTIAVVGPMISPSIYNPVLDDVEVDLSASQTQIGLSLSLYILFQGCIPLVWTTIAEIVGRKPVYITSFVLYTAGSAAGSRAPNMPILIGMRILQAVGSSAVVSSGAGSLADMYEIEERGRRLGWFYGMPMLGPTLGPLIGGALGNAYGWRSTLYFLAVFAFLMTVAFCFFPDTWRRERSRSYQKAMAAALRRQLKAQAVAEKREAKLERKRIRGLASTATTPAATRPPTPGALTPLEGEYDPETARINGPPSLVARLRARLGIKQSDELHPSFVDLNPLPSTISVFRAPTNAAVLVASGLLFAVQYTTTYTAAVTFARAPYNYNPLIIGVVLVAFGMGNVVGSVVGGRWSDYAMRRLTSRNGGTTEPEMRLQCTLPAMPVLLVAYLIYGWTAEYKTSIAGPVVGLFLAGFALLFVYSSTLAYLVDSNPGRSAPAVACNSSVRGIVACVMSQVAIPIQNAIGDGGLYTLFTGILALSCAMIVLVSYRGKRWREAKQARKEARSAATSGANSGVASGMASGVASGNASRAPSIKESTPSPTSTAVSGEEGQVGTFQGRDVKADAKNAGAGS
ncbi:MFS general substrate transporter [Cutaneotrichosporon oleaginosum]|uniref:MFS general substrate transporter n=1 Tax=Cutaneotrichosporon oleaginosum TaxID=879819 RepID=A0A0J1BBV2_9TREE|nr:MFS general substrate transporter [Cutaneotrichosporon oleaginosum]KLT45479.1 MFS general substrate transporter [Cutaneotrichosporon oleaginosum]TXT14565.1 hypothetical protein COLE_00758 [Cutaneotrichosporon oleaginosum]